MKFSRLLMTSALLAFGTLMAVPAFAQGGGGGAMAQMSSADRAKAQATRIQTTLSLSDADTAKLLTPLTAYYDANTKLMAASQGTPPSAEDRAKLTDQLTKDLVGAGFTADQAAKIVTAATARGGRRGGGF